MGGLGVWPLLQTHPEKWAAAVVLAEAKLALARLSRIIKIVT